MALDDTAGTDVTGIGSDCTRTFLLWCDWSQIVAACP